MAIALVNNYRARPNSFLHAAAAGNFRAFYCAGEAAVARANPYATEPLRSCEERIGRVSRQSAHVVEPSPLAPYDLAAFAVVSRLPYTIARPVFSLVLFAALLLATWYLSELSRLPRLLVFGALCLGGGYVPLVYGQITPIVLAALSAAAYYADRRSNGPLVAALAIAMIEPNIGVVAWLAGLLWFPKTRAPLAVVATGLAVASLVTIGFTHSLEYFSQVLPQQAQAEIVAVNQFSLSHLLHILGFADKDAMRFGAASFALATAIGLIVAKRARDFTGSDGLLIALPPVAILAGGSALHEFQIVAAFPAAFLLATRVKTAAPVAWFALILLVFPWFSFSTVPFALFAPTFAIAICSAGGLAYAGARSLSMLSRVLLTAGAAFGCFVLVLAFRHLPGPDEHHAIGATTTQAATSSASLRWGEYLRATPSASVPSWQKELEKLPPWLAMLGLIGVGASQRPWKAVAPREELPRLQSDPVRLTL